jgi:Lytic polysaccharide mono-oxygenase, cellulose-degrading
MKKTYILGFCLVGALTSTSARAHVEMLSPPPRLPGEAGGNQLKAKPCGQDTNARTTDKVTTFKPGEKVPIKMKEYINHPGYFAVGFDADGDDSLPFPLPADVATSSKDDPESLVNGTTILAVRPDTPDCAGEPDKTCTLEVTLPNVKCENCTLQLIQFMTDSSLAGAYYYQCADIKLVGDLAPIGGGGGGGAGGGSGAGGAAAGGNGAGGSPGAGGSNGGGGAGGTVNMPSGMAGATASSGAPSGGVASSGAAGTPSAGVPTTAGSGATPSNAGEDESSCGVAHRASGTASLLTALGLLFALGRRRRHAA